MDRWYQGAQVCYAYLSDVRRGDPGPIEHRREEGISGRAGGFTRGWMLQELLAPRKEDDEGGRQGLLGSLGIFDGNMPLLYGEGEKRLSRGFSTKS